jgi:hypothetical protein
MAYLAARMSLPFKGRLEGQDPTFDSFKPDYFIGLPPAKGTLAQDQENP